MIGDLFGGVKRVALLPPQASSGANLFGPALAPPFLRDESRGPSFDPATSSRFPTPTGA